MSEAVSETAVHPAVVLARFVSFRSSPSRGVGVLNMDVPLHRASVALETLGTPVLGESIHVAVVRLKSAAEAGGAPPPPPLHGTFESMRMIAVREALSLTIEVPGERLYVALRQLSLPTKSSDIQVAIARLLEQPQDPPRPSSRTPGQLAVQRCALRVKDEPFQRFILGAAYIARDPDGNELEAIEAVRKQLGIASRRELANDHEKLREWWAMEARYEDWLQDGGLETSVARDAR